MDDLMTIKECKDFNRQNDMNSSVISSSSDTSISNIFKSNTDLSSSFNQESPTKISPYEGFMKRSNTISNYDLFKFKNIAQGSGSYTGNELKPNSNSNGSFKRRRAISEGQGCEGSGGKTSLWMCSGAGNQENKGYFADRMRHASSKECVFSLFYNYKGLALNVVLVFNRI